MKIVKYHNRNEYFVQKYKKYLVSSRKSSNFAPQFVKGCVGRHFDSGKQENLLITFLIIKLV